MLKCLGLVILFWSNLSSAASFQGQTNFTAVPVEGELHIMCSDHTGSDSRYVICEDLILDPFEYGYFEAGTDIDADEVVIVSERSDGKRVEKKVGYDSTKGQSTKRVNLWIETVFQTALLDTGNNPVSYVLTKDGAVKGGGKFDVKVEQSEVKTCPSGFESSSSRQDCQFPDNMCRRYFARYNYCL